jgi:hypothetical protein
VGNQSANTVSFVNGVTAPLFQVTGGTLTTTGNLVSIPSGATLTLGHPAVDVINTGSLTANADVLSVSGTLTINGNAPLIKVSGGGSLTTTGTANIVGLTGSATALPETVEGNSLTLGTDRPLHGPGTCPSCSLANSIISANSGTITTNQAVRVDTALLEATAPLINMLASSQMTSNNDLVKLAQQAKLFGNVPGDALVKLNNSTLNVTGSLFNVAGGSFLNVVGNLFSLTSTSGNSSTLNITNGALVALSGGSVFKLTGSFGSFSGAGTNTVNLPTSLSGYTVNTSLGFGVALATGTSITQVVPTNFTPFTGLSGSNTVTNNGIVLKIADPSSKVRLCTTSCS